jgi:hypothetical protein
MARAMIVRAIRLSVGGFHMRIHDFALRCSRRVAAALLAPALLLLLPALAHAAAAPQQSTASSSQAGAATQRGAGQATAAAQPGPQPANATRPATQISNTAQGTQPRGVVSTRGITQTRRAGSVNSQLGANGGVTSTQTPAALATAQGDVIAAQRLALTQRLDAMDSRLGDLMAAVNSSTGSLRSEATVLLVQELVNQVSDLRRLLLESNLGGAGQVAAAQTPAVFITPSGAVTQGEDRRQHGLEVPATSAANPQSPTAAVMPSTPGAANAPVTSSMATQAQGRRQGSTNEPVNP